MVATGKPTLYEDVVAVTMAYLGPAADRFVIRQIRNHLGKDPEQLQARDLRKLMDWIQVAMRLISDDSRAIDSYMADLQTLVQTAAARPRHGRKVI